MLLGLSLGVVLLFAVTIGLFLKLHRQKTAFRSNIKLLQNSIADISKKQAESQERLMLSQELDQSIKAIKANLNASIFDFTVELIEILAKNNLLK